MIRPVNFNFNIKSLYNKSNKISCSEVPAKSDNKESKFISDKRKRNI